MNFVENDVSPMFVFFMVMIVSGGGESSHCSPMCYVANPDSRSNPSFLAPLTVAIYDGERNLFIYKCDGDVCTESQKFPLIYYFALSKDGTVLATSSFPLDESPPTQVVVYESVEGEFQVRADFNVTRNGTVFDVMSMAVSGDGAKLVMQCQRSEVGPGGFIVVREEYFRVEVWNEVSRQYEFDAEFFYETSAAADGFNTFTYQLALAVSQDGSTVAFGNSRCDKFDLTILVRDGAVVNATGAPVPSQNNTDKWVARSVPPLDATKCTDSGRPVANNNIALSNDGSMIAFRLGIDVQVFRWQLEKWDRVGEPFELIHYPVALSSDGTQLAIGSPEDGIGGITTVYSLPGPKDCQDKSLLRISLTIDRLPEDISWELKNNNTGEVLFKQDSYPANYTYATIMEEVCVDRDSCFEFTVLNKRNRGLQAPGQYALFLDGEDVGRGTFSGLVAKETFGNCASCPAGTEPVSAMIATCGLIRYIVSMVVDRDPKNYTILHDANTSGLAVNGTVLPSCDTQRVCDNALRLTHEACLDPSECYFIGVISPNKHQAYVEVSFAGNSTSGSPSATCAGEPVWFGNPDRCPILDRKLGQSFPFLP